MGKQKHTLNEWINLAKKFKYKSEFKKYSGYGYDLLRKKGILNNIFPYNKDMHKWTIEKIKETAAKYNSKTEFYKDYKYLQRLIWKKNLYNDVFNEYTKLGSKYNRCIYAFEFSDNYVYIGLTYNLDKRKQQHLHNKNSQVFKHIQLTNTQFILKQLTDYVDCFTASNLETEYLTLYKKQGWNILNKAKTGGLGSLKIHKEQKKSNRIKYNYDIVKNIASKCKTKTEFFTNYSSAYNYALHHNILNDICSHMPKYRHDNWTYESAIIEIQKYTKLSDFRKYSEHCYTFCKRNNIPINLKKGKELLYTSDNVKNTLTNYYKMNELRNSTDKFVKGCYWWLKRKKLINEYKQYLKHEII